MDQDCWFHVALFLRPDVYGALLSCGKAFRFLKTQGTELRVCTNAVVLVDQVVRLVKHHKIDLARAVLCHSRSRVSHELHRHKEHFDRVERLQHRIIKWQPSQAQGQCGDVLRVLVFIKSLGGTGINDPITHDLEELLLFPPIKRTMIMCAWCGDGMKSTKEIAKHNVKHMNPGLVNQHFGS